MKQNTCPIHITNCKKLSEILRNTSEKLDETRENICSNPNACLTYQEITGVTNGIIDIISKYNKIKVK